MKVGIICAVDTELQPFLPHIKNCNTSKKAMLTFYEGTINGVEIVTLFCGVGKTNAAIATQILIDTYGADVIINSGTAGGMDENLDLFDTVICTEATHHDVHEGILTQFQPWMPSVSIKACENLLAAAKRAASKLETENKIYFGRMVTGEKFIEDDGRDEIISMFAPLTVDMETASIAHTCYVNEIPYIAIRTITDTAKHKGTDNFEKNCPIASEISKDIVLELLNEMRK
ncbi:MAG: 5'-methylthioadenosine/adenosylhomocysteine nucleosidase [Firmicutes bacterium]|nr:5'-methylthioadenosine/adenosylhomocysteine nucleosidase [Bacillota bacterium]